MSKGNAFLLFQHSKTQYVLQQLGFFVPKSSIGYTKMHSMFRGRVKGCVSKCRAHLRKSLQFPHPGTRCHHTHRNVLLPCLCCLHCHTCSYRSGRFLWETQTLDTVCWKMSDFNKEQFNTQNLALLTGSTVCTSIVLNCCLTVCACSNSHRSLL